MVFEAIAIGVQGDKYRKEFRNQANLYRASLETLADKALTDLRPLLPTIATSAAFAGYGSLFCSAAIGSAYLYKAYVGGRAEKELTKFYNKLGADIEDIKNSLQAINESTHELVNHKSQHKFGQHAYEYAKMRIDHNLSMPENHYFFIYHSGNEWHPTFHRMNTNAPLPNFLGVFDNLDTLACWFQVLRKLLGDKAVFHVLMPSTRLYAVTEALSLPPEAYPLVFEGELHNGTGKPYNHVNIPQAPSGTFHNIRNLADEKPASKPSIWKKVASTSAAWGAGLPAAVVATPGGLIVGLLGAATLPVAAPAALVVGVVGVAGVAAGASAGAVTGLFVGKKVEEAWEESEDKHSK